MLNVEIRRPRFDDVEELHEFFRTVLIDTFAKEGLAHMIDEIEKEIEDKKIYLNEDIESNGEKRYFLIALDNGKIIGTIEYGPTGELIINCTDGKLKGVVEVGTAFVHPSYQKQGVGTIMLNMIYLTLINRNINEFCLDSGYKNAQKVWKKKFGEPDYILKDFWGEGYDHMIWRRLTSDMPIKFRICL